jgi:prophage DNA circulation protein
MSGPGAVTNTFLEHLRPASWRGVPFEVNGDDAEFGRRVVVHEYPQRDKPYVEDLGRKTRKFTLDAWVCAHVDNDFDPWGARDALIEAIEAGDVGTLVHPFWGSLEGNISNVKVKQTGTTNGGYVNFTMDFVESGEMEFRASAVADTEGQVLTGEEDAYNAAIDDFATTFTTDF